MPLPASADSVSRVQAPAGRSSFALLVAGALLVVAGGSIIWVKLAPAVLVLSLIGYLTLPKHTQQPRIARIVLAGSTVLAIAGFLRFVLSEAIPGMVQGGRQAMSRVAISQLRQILFAQDTLRRHALIDPDRDGIGSAAFVAELAGVVPLRRGARLPEALVQRHSGELVQTELGPAMHSGAHLFLVCLPKEGGGWTASPGDTVDEERAERRYLAYAWPADAREPGEAYFLDEHETILIANNQPGSGAVYSGGSEPPPCDAAVSDATRWKPWKGKRPRGELPGDRR
jgi:hypothetical protein